MESTCLLRLFAMLKIHEHIYRTSIIFSFLTFKTHEQNLNFADIFPNIENHLPSETYFSTSEIRDTLRSFKNGSAPGPSGSEKNVIRLLMKFIHN